MEKVFRDPVHDIIVVDDPLILALVDSPEFQRLRRIRQLGAAAWTYHGAEHTRFSHSLGVYHVMKRLLGRLMETGFDVEDGERQAALCAALLHDLGHGPLSHLWEAVGSGESGHEGWTRAIVVGDSGVNRTLAQRDAGLPRLVIEILAGDYRRPQIPLLISGQLDVDRMDYLLRDALFTGASYGRFDLERLIHSITVADGRVVVTRKGLANVEEYLLARYFMYWRVYFHKSVRSQELTLRMLFTRVRDLFAAGHAPECSAALRPFLAAGGNAGGIAGENEGEGVSVAQYLALDDHDVMCAIKRWTAGADPVLRDLAGRFLNRRMLKPVFPEPAAGEALAGVAAAEGVLRRRGWDPRYYLAVDRTFEAAYDYYSPGEFRQRGASPIHILQEDGRVREVTELSPLLGSIAAHPRRGLNVYVPEDCRPEVRRVLRDRAP